MDSLVPAFEKMQNTLAGKEGQSPSASFAKTIIELDRHSCGHFGRAPPMDSEERNVNPQETTLLHTSFMARSTNIPEPKLTWLSSAKIIFFVEYTCDRVF